MASAHPRDVAPVRRRVVELTRQGRSATEIARIVGITERSVQRHRRAAGLTQPPPPPMSADELYRAELMLDDGCSYSEVACTLGRAGSTIRDHFPGRGWTAAQTIAHILAGRAYRKAVKDRIGVFNV